MNVAAGHNKVGNSHRSLQCEGYDFASFSEVSENGGRRSMEYALTLDTATELTRKLGSRDKNGLGDSSGDRHCVAYIL